MEKGNRKYHLLDRYAGIPINFMLGAFRRKVRSAPENIQTIGILNLFSIGDNVLMSAAIADLKAAYPQATFIAFAAKNNYALVKLIPGFSTVLQLPIADPRAAIKLIKQQETVDILFDFGSWPRVSAIYSYFIKARYKVGFQSPGQWRHFIYDQKVSYSSTIHEVDNYRNLIASFYNGNRHLPFISCPPTAATTSMIQTAGRYCILHAWPGGYKSYLKQWADERWAQLAHRLAPHFDTLLLTGAPGDKEKAATLASLITRDPLPCKFIDISGGFNIGETAHLLKMADTVISVDTGISHMSAAFHKPLVCLQGPASSVRWRPYSDQAIVVNPDKGTFGYLSFGFEYHLAKENCMENISVDAVYEAFKKLPREQVSSAK